MNQILKRQTSPFHYGSKFPVVTITVFITILEQNRYNSSQSSTKLSEVNVKDTFTPHIDSKIFLIFSLKPYLYTLSLYENKKRRKQQTMGHKVLHRKQMIRTPPPKKEKEEENKINDFYLVYNKIINQWKCRVVLIL